MIMFEQSRWPPEPVGWGRREKAAVAALASCVVLALIALGAYALSSGGRARSDCVKVNFASTLGGAELHACGAQARRVCASGDFRGIRQELSVACRRAGFPYRPPA
jgi:hypothetical protein